MRAKILVIIDQLEMGGAEIFVLNIYQKMIDKFDIYFLILRKSDPFYIAKAKSFAKKVIIFDFNPKKPFGLIKKIKEEIQKINPEIVHTHLTYSDIYGRLAARKAKITLIFSTVHSLEPWRGNIFNPTGLRLMLLDKYLSYSTRKIIAISKQMARMLNKKEKIPVNKIKLIYNGVDTEKFKPQEKLEEKITLLGLNPNKITFGFIGRLEEPKGLIYLFQALNKIKNTNLQVLIVGEGSQKRKLQKLALKLKNRVNVVFAGKRNDIVDILNMIDVFVFPSIWEGLPIALLEAMACQKLIIATKIAGVKEVLNNNEGILIPAKNSNALFRAITESMKNKKKFKKMKIFARLKVIRKFSLIKTAKKYKKLYLDSLNE